NGYDRSGLGHFQFRVPRQSTETQLAIATLNVVQPRNEIDINECGGPRQPHFHQRDKTLSTGKHPRIVTQLLQKFGSLRERFRAMIRKGMSVHSCLARLEEWLARGSRNEDLVFPAHFIAIAAA